MKYFIATVIASLLLFSCSSNETTSTSETEEPISVNLIHKVLLDFSKIKDLDKKAPISSLKVLAEQASEKKRNLFKNNINEILEESKNYKHCIIITENHTAIMFDNIDNCKPSGSWGACMPFAEGYIKKKKDLIPQSDYINNIIGIPDQQSRTAYFFN